MFTVTSKVEEHRAEKYILEMATAGIGDYGKVNRRLRGSRVVGGNRKSKKFHVNIFNNRFS